MPLPSSSIYTFQKPTTSKRKYLFSTVVIGLLSLGGAIGVDLYLNPGALSALFTGGGVTTNGGAKTATGDAVESGFGQVQVRVTKENGKITAVDMVQANATAGRESAFSTLVQAAIDSNGSNFGNLSGATYTTNAFKKSLDSAVSKLG